MGFLKTPAIRLHKYNTIYNSHNELHILNYKAVYLKIVISPGLI